MSDLSPGDGAGGATATPRVLVLSGGWGGADAETAFVTRSLAGALSRHAHVEVATRRGAPPDPVPDGLFDTIAMGQPESPRADRVERIDRPGTTWLDADDPGWARFGPPDAVLTEAGDAAANHLARTRFGTAALIAIAASPRAGNGDAPEPAVRPIGTPDLSLALEPPLPGSDTSVGHSAAVMHLGPYVPVNPLASQRRHYGLGFTGYTLVLSDRGGDPQPDVPTSLVAWLTAAFPLLDIVVIEGGQANVWKGRARRGAIPVDTRADLWRLMAHARLTVDLAPGKLLARECIETLRFGVPIVIPSGRVGASLAEVGGRTFTNEATLIAAVQWLTQNETAQRAGASGRVAADRHYGNPRQFVDQVGSALNVALSKR